MNYLAAYPAGFGEDNESHLFEAIAQNIYDKGYSILPNALPSYLANLLWNHLQEMPSFKFKRAGVGRDENHVVNNFLRTDEVCWINGESEAGKAWLHWAGSLQTFLNRRLLLGLFSFESHFAHYAVGDYYKKHQDAFKGDTNRVLSLVVYFNPDWLSEDGGELVIYTGEREEDSAKVTPRFGTIVVFLSEEFPHEVLLTNRNRFSIAGWFRVNSSNAVRVDPPM